MIGRTARILIYLLTFPIVTALNICKSEIGKIGTAVSKPAKLGNGIGDMPSGWR
jgi:hypothetical protein